MGQISKKKYFFWIFDLPSNTGHSGKLISIYMLIEIYGYSTGGNRWNEKKITWNFSLP